MSLFSLLPMIAFLLLGLFLVARHDEKISGNLDVRKAIIQASLIWSAYLVISTECLSLIKGLTRLGVVIAWLLPIALFGLIFWRGKLFIKGWQKLKVLLTHLRLGWFDWFALGVIVVVLSILLITGLMSPPNVHDVLAYHMSRVMHWMQNRSLTFYPTAYTWQLWMPPFSEYSQLHWYLLVGNDVLTSLPQWYSLILIMVAVSLTAKHLGAGRRGQWLAALFMLTVPIVVLQASGAKNDIVLGFTIAAVLSYVVQGTFSTLTFFDWIGAGIAVGLGVLTKGTFAFFALPFLLWLLVVMLRKIGWQRTFMFAALGLGLLILLNGGHWVRNTLTFGSPLYTAEEAYLINDRFGVKETISNLTRHAAVQMNGKYGFINETVITSLRTIHSWLELPLFDPQITLGPAEFYYVPNREEVAGNPFHFVMMLLSFLVLFFSMIRKENRDKSSIAFVLAATAVAGLLLFSTIFRWQAWSTRFFIPFYVIGAPVFGFVFSRTLPRFTSWAIGLALLLVLMNPMLNNYSRSFSWSAENRNSIWRLSRKGLLFANNQNIEGAVLELAKLMDSSGCRSYGLIIRSNAPEYLLWASLTPQPGDYYLEHIAVNNMTKHHTSSGFDPCGIVLFEITELDQVDDSKFNLVQRWKIGDEYPFSLFINPVHNLLLGDEKK